MLLPSPQAKSVLLDAVFLGGLVPNYSSWLRFSSDVTLYVVGQHRYEQGRYTTNVALCFVMFRYVMFRYVMFRYVSLRFVIFILYVTLNNFTLKALRYSHSDPIPPHCFYNSVYITACTPRDHNVNHSVWW